MIQQSLFFPSQVISTPDEENPMYTQQRDEYLEHVCELGVRKISLITIFGSLTNGTMKMDHYQAGKSSFELFVANFQFYFTLMTV